MGEGHRIISGKKQKGVKNSRLYTFRKLPAAPFLGLSELKGFLMVVVPQDENFMWRRIEGASKVPSILYHLKNIRSPPAALISNGLEALLVSGVLW